MYRLYIGANNATGQVELDKIRETVSGKFDGFTLYQTTGYWKGQAEASCIVEIGTDDSSSVDEIAKVLCNILDQQAIGLQYVKDDLTFIGK